MSPVWQRTERKDRTGQDRTLDTDRIDEAALAILSLTLHDGDRVWKAIAWDITNRLFEKGLIADPKGKAKSLALTRDGIARARAILARDFSQPERSADAP
ncbi:DUF6429 family protein [Roseovarius ramblicola]